MHILILQDTAIFIAPFNQYKFHYRSKGPCDVFDPWVRWERGQVGIWEFSSSAASGNLGTWKFGILGIWRSGDLKIQKFWDLGTWKFKILGSQKSKKWKVSKIKSVLPKMSARSGLVGKKSSRPYLGPSEAIFSMDRKNPKNYKKMFIFAYFPGLGPLLLSTRGGGIGIYLHCGVRWDASWILFRSGID